MEKITNFWSGLSFLFAILWKLVIVTGITLFVIILVNMILKRINFSWSQKFVKRLDQIILSAEGLKSIISSFEKLIDILFNAFAGLINLFAVFIDVVFISINKFLLSPLEILISYMNLFSKKMEVFNNNLKDNKSQDDTVTANESKYSKINDNTDELMNSMLQEKNKGKTSKENKADTILGSGSSKEEKVRNNVDL